MHRLCDNPLLSGPLVSSHGAACRILYWIRIRMGRCTPFGEPLRRSCTPYLWCVPRTANSTCASMPPQFADILHKLEPHTRLHILSRVTRMMPACRCMRSRWKLRCWPLPFCASTTCALLASPSTSWTSTACALPTGASSDLWLSLFCMFLCGSRSPHERFLVQLLLAEIEKPTSPYLRSVWPADNCIAHFDEGCQGTHNVPINFKYKYKYNLTSTNVTCKSIDELFF